MSSPWPYQFLALSEEDKVNRRVLLDLRGQYAQWSIIFAILAIKILKALTTINSKNQSKRSLSGWDRPLFAGWFETRRQYLICGLWLSWLVALSVWSSGEGMRLILVRHAAWNTLANLYGRLPSFDKSVWPGRPVSTPAPSTDVSNGIHLVKASNFIRSIRYHRRPSVDSDALPPSFRSGGHFAAVAGPRHALSAVLRAI